MVNAEDLASSTGLIISANFRLKALLNHANRWGYFSVPNPNSKKNLTGVTALMLELVSKQVSIDAIAINSFGLYGRVGYIDSNGPNGKSPPGVL